jgi:Zn-dependent membrane protease YugP
MSYIILIISLIITLSAQVYVNSTYSKYSKEKTNKGETGEQVARKILDRAGLDNVAVFETNGILSDHYDPKQKAVFLSSGNFNSSSIGAISVAAHECGHAIQHQQKYIFMNIRAALVPFVNIASYAGYFAILLGVILGALDLIWLGILAECIILAFQLITLPVEFNASNRALKILETDNYLTKKELTGGKKVLRAAALTYVAAVATTLLEIFRLIILYGRRDD